MQKFHPILAWLILLLLIVHLVMGSVTLLTPVFLINKPFVTVFFAMVCLHAVISLAKMLRKGRARNRFSYLKENGTYWLRVLSGLAILVLALIHTTLWVVHTPFGVIMREFGWSSLLLQMLFVATLTMHILLNIRPLLLDSAIDPTGRAKRWMSGITVILAALAAVAAICYFAGVSV